MGVGGNFWDLLKPYARTEGFDFLRNKRVAVDLSYWIVQHETAIKGHVRNPHIRLTFFRTINLFSKFGAFPVFVVDGTPSPLKSQARILRFFRASGIDTSSLPVQEEGVSVERNKAFLNCVQQCVELLTLLGMPVLRARGEAEALCAQLNMEGSVDACITSDSDAFLFGAKCVIKSLKPNFQEPFECYQMSDIETGLGLRRKHLIAISLLVGNDHDLNGVQGIGLDTALRFVKSFSEDDVLDRLHLIGRGDMLHHQGSMCPSAFAQDSDENMKKARSPHCSQCGHPGSKTAHLKHACVYCSPSTSEGCMLKPAGFKCDCTSCDLDKKEKEQKKIQNWQIRVCERIAKEPNFPNDVIIDMYLCNNHGNFTDSGPSISWENPNTEMLVDYLAYHQNWEPSYIRQRLIPLLSTIFLRGMASDRTTDLLYGQYEFHSIQRVKTRFGHQFYMVNWKKASPANNDSMYKLPSEEPDDLQGDQDECIDSLDEPDVTKVHSEKGCLFLLTDENIELVKAAYPEKVAQFLLEKEQKEMNSRKKKKSLKSLVTPEKSSISPTTKSVQLNITEFYRASKVTHQENKTESEKANGLSEGKRRSVSPIPKSVRRRLLFD